MDKAFGTFNKEVENVRLLLTRIFSKLLNQSLSILLSSFKCSKYVDNKGIFLSSCSSWTAKNAMARLMLYVS